MEMIPGTCYCSHNIANELFCFVLVWFLLLLLCFVFFVFFCFQFLKVRALGGWGWGGARIKASYNIYTTLYCENNY